MDQDLLFGVLWININSIFVPETVLSFLICNSISTSRLFCTCILCSWVSLVALHMSLRTLPESTDQLHIPYSGHFCVHNFFSSFQWPALHACGIALLISPSIWAFLGGWNIQIFFVSKYSKAHAIHNVRQEDVSCITYLRECPRFSYFYYLTSLTNYYL